MSRGEGRGPASEGSTPNRLERRDWGKHRRVRRRSEFLRVQKTGRPRHSTNFVVLCLRQSPPRGSRFGFSVSRRVGNAVIRNRVKRRLREFIRLHRSELPAGRDFVIIAKPGAANISYADLVEELREPLST